MDVDQTWHASGQISGNILNAGAKPHPTNAIEQKLSSESCFTSSEKKKKLALIDSTFR